MKGTYCRHSVGGIACRSTCTSMASLLYGAVYAASLLAPPRTFDGICRIQNI